jgi:hypothetical protein
VFWPDTGANNHAALANLPVFLFSSNKLDSISTMDFLPQLVSPSPPSNPEYSPTCLQRWCPRKGRFIYAAVLTGFGLLMPNLDAGALLTIAGLLIIAFELGVRIRGQWIHWRSGARGLLPSFKYAVLSGAAIAAILIIVARQAAKAPIMGDFLKGATIKSRLSSTPSPPEKAIPVLLKRIPSSKAFSKGRRRPGVSLTGLVQPRLTLTLRPPSRLRSMLSLFA